MIGTDTHRHGIEQHAGGGEDLDLGLEQRGAAERHEACGVAHEGDEAAVRRDGDEVLAEVVERPRQLVHVLPAVEDILQRRPLERGV
jgi:hypothetical protein